MEKPFALPIAISFGISFGGALLVAGCGAQIHLGGGGHGQDAGSPLEGLSAIVVAPDGQSLVATDSVPATVSYTATGQFLDGHSADVTALLTWTVVDSGLGTISNSGAGSTGESPDGGAVGALYTSTTARGGKSAVLATGGGQSGMAQFTLKLVTSRVVTDDSSTAPADSAAEFAATTQSADPTLAPTLVYPLDSVFLPPNLSELEVQWQLAATPADLYQVSFECDTLDLRLYTNAVLPGNAGRIKLSPADWGLLASSTDSEPVAVAVAARNKADPTKSAALPPIHLALGRDQVSGGIYYWSASGGATSEGIERHAFGDTTTMATPFFTEADGGKILGTAGDCVACHVLSRDGTKFAITFDGGDGVSALLDVATKTQIVPASQGLHWNFAAMNPDGTRMVASSHGVLSILDTTSGMTLSTIKPNAGYLGTHPDWSPDGKSIVYVGVPTAAYTSDWSFTVGSLFITTDTGNGFVTNRLLVPQKAAQNNYYPSFSPDNNWVLFNQSQSGSYSAGDAHLFVISADGTTGPIALTTADTTTPLTNSWPRWSPFVQPNGPDGNLFYFTFSSKRPYGIEVPNPAPDANRTPQVWMAAFDPNHTNPQGMPTPISFAPFWLPFQDPTTHNHIAQWTTAIVGVQ